MASKLRWRVALWVCAWQAERVLADLVDTANGPVQGVYRDVAEKTASWWGLPYAQPPTEERRFKAPQPFLGSWTEPRQATRIPPECTQSAGRSVSGQEDCLYLNVHAPVPDRTTSRPVLVWLYGGGFSVGDSYSMGLYDGQHLAWKHEVVVVTLNYRLCVLGFMALDALQNESSTGSTGNHALQDQQLALRWVQANIRNFGGDPDRVTLFGESAGAFSVMWHLVSQKSAGLFHGAIMESGTVDATFFFQPLAQAKEYYEDLATRLHCPASLGAGQLPCLRALPAQALVAVEAGMDGHRPSVHSPLWPLMPNGPAIDGTEDGLADIPIRLVQRGAFNKVPLLLGANENGGSIFEDMLPEVLPGAQLPVRRHPATLGEALRYFFRENVTQVEAIYQESEFGGDGDEMMKRMIRDMMFMCPLRALSSAWAQHDLPAYMYVFDFSYGLAKIIGLGDFHGSELPFVFRNWLEFIKPIDPFHSPRHMADIISCKWTSFAYALDPNGGVDESRWPPGCEDINREFSDWPRFHATQRLFYDLKGRPEVHEILADNRYPDDLFPRDPKCNLWDELASTLHWVHEGPSSRSFAGLIV